MSPEFTLEAGGLVEKVERGHYKISDEGCGRMAERISGEQYEQVPSI